MNPNHGRLGHTFLKKLLTDFQSQRSLRLTTKLLKTDNSIKNESDSVANGSNATYIDILFRKWSKDPGSVDESWDAYFRGNQRTIKADQMTKHKKWEPKSRIEPTAQKTIPNADWNYIDDHLVVQAIIRAYQTRGHLAADLDPLGIVGPKGHSLASDDKKLQATKAVLRQHYNYAFNDLNALFKLPSSTLIGGDDKFLPLKEILDRLERCYCGHIGVEYMSITSFYKSNWIREHFEKPNCINFSAAEKKLILERLTRSTGFENFLAKKYMAEKRFGLEGCDIMIPVMKEIIDQSAKLDVDSVHIGMAHRGRLNVLANICRKPLEEILSQFKSISASDWGSGDVKYHLGLYSKRLNRQSNREVRITVVANPSHLEFVNPVVLGKARAEMAVRGDSQGNKVLPILIHGDASFCGQGVVYESMHMSDLPAYTTYGTIHVVVNNQVGFTTDPRFSRSSRYCTDVARVVNAPILHVNADDPEACIHCARVAAKWRAKYHKDVVIDIVGYRRNGHNEADEPAFTQPLMYQRIRKLAPVTVKYAEKLTREGVIKMEEYTEMVAKYDKICNDAFDAAKKINTFKNSHWIDSPWSGFFQGRDRLRMCPTGVNIKVLQHIANIYSSPPPEENKFEIHKGIMRILNLRKKMVEEQVTDWSLGEAFAFGTLVKDGIHVRVSGQDVERGTFSHRHHVLHHQSKDKSTYTSLQHLYPDQASYNVCNSSLSECAIMGFDLGYSVSNPNVLVIWEAQFGDFANTAQPIIDTFIASGETKWVRQTGLVLLLPHSMEGMGPEHSSGRIERFLQMSDDDADCMPNLCDEHFVARQLNDINWIVTNVSTPANLFHVLRRQMAMGFRKPLVNFSPKSLLRHPLARSPFSDYTECSSFQRLIPEKGKACEDPDCVKKLIFCSGKVYFDLIKEREDHEQEDSCAIARVEQICPFPYDLVLDQIKLYKNADLLWVQEEHKNQGAWTYVQTRFDTALLELPDNERYFVYYGRPPNSASATGNKVQHNTEYNELITSIFGELTEENKKRMEEKKKNAQEEALKRSEASLAKAKLAKIKEGVEQVGPKGPDDEPKPPSKGASAPPSSAATPPSPKRAGEPPSSAATPPPSAPTPARSSSPGASHSSSPAAKQAADIPQSHPSPAKQVPRSPLRSATSASPEPIRKEPVHIIKVIPYLGSKPQLAQKETPTKKASSHAEPARKPHPATATPPSSQPGATPSPARSKSPDEKAAQETDITLIRRRSPLSLTKKQRSHKGDASDGKSTHKKNHQPAQPAKKSELDDEDP